MADDFFTPEEEAEWKTLDYLKSRGLAYKLSANQPAFQEMLMDLATFCRANETCIIRDKNGRIDETATFILEGRREVWLRIQAHLNLTSKQLFMLFTGKPFKQGEIDDGHDDNANHSDNANDGRYTMVSGES